MGYREAIAILLAEGFSEAELRTALELSTWGSRPALADIDPPSGWRGRLAAHVEEAAGQVRRRSDGGRRGTPARPRLRGTDLAEDFQKTLDLYEIAQKIRFDR